MAALDDAALDLIFREARTRNGWADTPVSDAEIEAIYDLLKWAPTSGNGSPARFVWVKSAAEKEKLAACSSGSNAAKILAAPVTVLIGRDREFHEKLPELFPHGPYMYELMRDNEAVRAATAQRNATLQGAYLIIAARALGFDCGPMSGFDAAKVNETFFAGTTVEIDFICSIGHGTEENLFPRLPRLSFTDANRIV